MAWTGTAHDLIGELGLGTVTGSTLQMGLGLAALLAGLGATFLLVGLGLAWAASTKRETSQEARQSESSARELLEV